MSVVALKDFQPDPKGPPRIRDTAACRRKVLRDRECRATGEPASDAHHILFRSLGGDDVEENIAPLAHYAHMLFHSGIGEDQRLIAREIGLRLTPEEVGYLVGKLGRGRAVAYLRRHYRWSRYTWEQRHGPLEDVPLHFTAEEEVAQ